MPTRSFGRSPPSDTKLYTIFEGTSEIQRVVIARALTDAAPDGPLHHHLPGDKPGLSRTFGRRTLRRSRAGMVLLRIAEATPALLMRAGAKVISPPRRK